jgi:hypothetical protein|tara:strand:+ start:292 stop:483 length:192 start_codon:yes stop_codon:yes gene_type:complete
VGVIFKVIPTTSMRKKMTQRNKFMITPETIKKIIEGLNDTRQIPKNRVPEGERTMVERIWKKT